MTKFVEFPLRPQGQPWPGLNTRGGKLDPGQGQLEDGSFNAIINEADTLSKRKGLIRGLDERFAGVVCGLFRYTDECGVEYVVVADQDGIKVRTPFSIPTFLGSDSLPNDTFDDLDTTRWSPTADYRTQLGSLLLQGLATLTSDDFVAASRLMQWFKPSAILSYQVEIQYAMVAAGSKQVASVVIKRTVNTYLQANVILDGSSYSVSLQIVQASVRSTLQSSLIDGAALATGFLRLAFNAETLTATLRVIPAGGAQVSLGAVLTEAQVNNLGHNSAIGLAHAASDELQIEGVSGGSV